MNEFRVARKYIEKLTDEELKEIHEASKKDESHEGMVIYYLTTCELERRKPNSLPNS